MAYKGRFSSMNLKSPALSSALDGIVSVMSLRCSFMDARIANGILNFRQKHIRLLSVTPPCGAVARLHRFHSDGGDAVAIP